MAGLHSSFTRGRNRFSCVVAIFAGFLAASAAPAQAFANSSPEILDFAIEDLGLGYFVFYGLVDDEDPSSCRVSFGGAIDGYVVDVGTDGVFSLVLELPPGINGYVSAVAYDSSSAESNTAWDYLDNP